MNSGTLTLLDQKNDVCIETGARLNLKFEGSDREMGCIFVGGRTGRYIVLTCPPELDSGGNMPVKGSRVVARFFREGRALEFQARFVTFASDPVRLILLEYPDSVRECDLRAQKRITCFISATIEVETEDHAGVVTGVIQNISKNGCRFLIRTSQNKVFRNDEEVTLRCRFPGIVGEQEALGRVQDIQKEDDEISVGIAFSDLLWWVPPYA
ncbi:MAG: hypothetical protein DRH37_00445 [Deltaproteobacteria bacterium]|nr:MAG: hypothetical protein DRH37_00445 [Deltaproteobacteria bacterium]